MLVGATWMDLLPLCAGLVPSTVTWVAVPAVIVQGAGGAPGASASKSSQKTIPGRAPQRDALLPPPVPPWLTPPLPA